MSRICALSMDYGGGVGGGFSGDKGGDYTKRYILSPCPLFTIDSGRFPLDYSRLGFVMSE